MSPLPLRLGKILINGKYTDCHFLLDNNSEIIPAHKLILAAASEVFEAMFYGSFAANNVMITEPLLPHGQPSVPITIVDVSSRIWRVILEFIYTDGFEDWECLTTYDLLELYYCAEKYLLRDLVSLTVDRLLKTLNCNSLFLVYDFSIRFKIKPLLDDSRRLLRELLDRKPNLFFKRVFHVNCDRVIREEMAIEDDEEEDVENHLPAKRKAKPPVPIEFIDDIVFGGTSSGEDQDNQDNLLGDYHHVSRECLNDLLLLNYDDTNGIFNENLLLFVLKWTKIEWRLHRPTSDLKLPLKKLPLIHFYESFVCHKRTLPLVENLMLFLDNHCHLNAVERIPEQGWYLMQRIDLKASRPLTIVPSDMSVEPQFETRFQVNHLITIKSFNINSRLNGVVQSRAMRFNRQYLYKENVTLEILVDDMERAPIVVHRQQFNLEAEFNSSCELFLNKCVYFQPETKYILRFKWPRDSVQTMEYPRKIFERCQSTRISGRQFATVFGDGEEDRESDGANELIRRINCGGILQGFRFMFA